jgi:hypothetical protein
MGEYSMAEHSEDDAVANWIPWIYAHVINFCFGLEEERTFENWEILNNQVDDWRRVLPPSFTPLFYRGRDPDPDNPFPAIWFLCEWHSKFGFQLSFLLLLHRFSVIYSCHFLNIHGNIELTSAVPVLGMQSYHMAKALLNLHRPQVPMTGIEKLSHQRTQEVRPLKDLQRLQTRSNLSCSNLKAFDRQISCTTFDSFVESLSRIPAKRRGSMEASSLLYVRDSSYSPC